MIDIVITTSSFLMNGKIKEITEERRDKFKELEIKEFDLNKNGDQFDDVLEAVSTVSFFNEHRIVIVKMDAVNKEDEERILPLLNLTIYDLSLIFCFKKKPLASSKVGKALKTLNVHVLKAQTDNEVLNQIRFAVKHRGLNIEKDALLTLQNNLKSQPERLEQELNKLELYDGNINKALIEELVPASLDDNVFALSDAVLKKDLKTAFEIYHALITNGVEPIQLMGLLGGSFRRLYQITSLKQIGYSNDGIAKALGISDKQVYFLLKNRKRPWRDILKLLNDLAIMDQKIKLGLQDRFLSFELWLYQACQ
ncbi:DNA polymerase III subunit delta [Erysipelothrix urinaevulpis]|uniref:DNA polymerase III subunit delta n=1 Tax=Erysipelothrix urinaevulpis TaxID=2683717 RepID=UPI00135A741C|nr:DNA polymerase III subunit delta [Erysipelothrix urinaevulpis]